MAIRLYRGKDENRPAGVSATIWAHVRLTEPNILHNKTQITGTLTCHSWCPKEHHFKHSGQKARRGMRAVQTQLTYTPLYYTAQMDKKPVQVLSTLAASVDVVRRNSKRMLEDSTSRWS
jgi:hypothetical protein